MILQFAQIAFRLDGGLASRCGGSDGLTVMRVCHVTCCEYSGNIGLGSTVNRPYIACFVQVEPLGEHVRVRLVTDCQEESVDVALKTSAVIDRTSLILEIFAQRAKTSYAKMQVELARYNYMLPRLAGMWTHLERQRGGHGTRGGMGETQIEVDRRIVKERITKLKEQLKKVDRQMSTQRGNRGQMVRLALVGYTNVGKSTLMNLLAKSDVFAENKLFATLDTTVLI